LTLGELIEGVGDDGALPKDWDPKEPCANAKPPIAHSHTFWSDGRFNSYDENEQTVDFGRWALVDDHTVRIGEPDPDAGFTFTVSGNELRLEPIIPPDCSSGECLGTLGWQFAVALPGEAWTRVTDGVHVPPETRS